MQMEKPLNYKFGIPQDKKDLEPLFRPTIKGPWEQFWPIPSLIHNHFKALNIG